MAGNINEEIWLKSQLQQTNEQNQALKQAVCELNPTAGICQC